MKRILVLLVASLSALCAVGVAAASAETGVLCESAPASHECLAQYPKGTEVTGTAAEEVKITGNNNIRVSTCTESAIGFSYDGSSTLESPSLSLKGCSEPQNPKPTGSLELLWSEPTDATFTSHMQMTLTVLGHTGTYELSSGGIELTGGTSPKLKFNGANLYGVSGDYLTGLRFWGTYNLSPTPLYVEKPVSYGVLCKSAPVSGHCEAGSQYPAGTEFAATLVSGSSITVKGAFGITLTQCKGSEIQLRYDGLSELEYMGSSWSECTRSTSDASNGALFVKYKATGNELFEGTGQLVEVSNAPYYGNYAFGPTGVRVELLRGSSPRIKFNWAPVTGTSSSLGTATAEMYGEYDLSPTPVYVGEA